jgi:hypothetical protein
MVPHRPVDLIRQNVRQIAAALAPDGGRHQRAGWMIAGETKAIGLRGAFDCV